MAIEITQNLTQVTISSVGVQGPKGEAGEAGVSQDVSMFLSSSTFNEFTSSIQSEVNSIKAWTASLELINTIDTELLQFYQTTASLNTQTGSQDLVNLSISSVTGSINSTTSSLIGITNELMAYTSSNESWKDGIRGEISAIESWTSSLELINTIDTELLQILQTTASLNSKTGSYATTGSNVFSGNQTISDSLIVSEIVSTTAPAEGDIASAGETGITYLTGDLTKWAIFREDAFTIGVWTDVVAGWAVTDNNGFTDIIAGRGSFGAASFQTTANNWPAPASGRTYVFTSPDYQSESANPLEITIGNNNWVFGVGGDLDVPGNINDAPNLATTGSNTFVSNQTISGSLFVSGATEFGGDLVPKTVRGATLGTLEKPFREIFVSSGSINIASDNPGDPNTSLSNEGGNILVSAGGMRLIEPGNSFISETGSFSFISGSMTQVGDYIQYGDKIIEGDLIVTGSVEISGPITASVVSSSYMKFDSLPNGTAPSYQEGLLYYDNDMGALTFYNNEADIALQIGQEQYIRAINKSGGDILNGTPVRVSGSQGDRVKIYKAEAFIHTGSYNTGETENHIVGITTHDILNDEDGYVTISGLVKGINTSNYNAGDVLYVQTGSAGVLTNSAPQFPYDKIQVGIVSRKHASVGEILVLPKEPTHFGNITGLSGSLTNEVGDLWVYKSNGAWATSKTLEGDYTITGSLDIVGSGSLNGDNIVSSNTIMKIETISSASYAALNPPVSGTLYIII